MVVPIQMVLFALERVSDLWRVLLLYLPGQTDEDYVHNPLCYYSRATCGAAASKQDREEKHKPLSSVAFRNQSAMAHWQG